MTTQNQSKVPMLDLSAQYESIRDEVEPAVLRVLASQYFILGAEGEALEREIAQYVGVGHAIGCASGSDALLLPLMALDVKAGDEVIIPPFTFFATAGAVVRLGAKPVFVDIEPDGFNLDVLRLNDAITWRTKAIMPVHLFGQTADMPAIRDIADLHGVPIVEDAAQAIGAEQNGKRAGSLAHMASFSFYPTKNLGGAGDGGMVTTDDVELAEKMRILRNHGMRPKYVYRMVGLNSRLDEVQAAVLRIKLRHLDDWQEKRARNAGIYTRLLHEAGIQDRVVTPPVLAGRKHVFNQYVVRVREGRRDELRDFLTSKGVGTEIYYPMSLHEQECFRSLGHTTGAFPESERAAAEVLALPMFPELSSGQIEAVVGRIAEFFASR